MKEQIKDFIKYRKQLPRPIYQQMILLIIFGIVIMGARFASLVVYVPVVEETE